MRNARVLGICVLIIGALFIADGLLPPPIRWPRVGMGVMFAVAGILHFRRVRPADPPTA